MVCYFYAPPRCKTCVQLEAFAKDLMERKFAEELKTGKIEWRAVDYNAAENAGMASTYGLHTKHIVLMEEVDGKVMKWKDMSELWAKMRGANGELEKYITSEVKSYL